MSTQRTSKSKLRILSGNGASSRLGSPPFWHGFWRSCFDVRKSLCARQITGLYTFPQPIDFSSSNNLACTLLHEHLRGSGHPPLFDTPQGTRECLGLQILSLNASICKLLKRFPSSNSIP
ncbi:hypothetical protein FVE85_7057 [Porphyridium purpureum]|uniref:Uncharacterized protein n=1 Tax=Porphyridium purpureum TaxID=35688 RepID=A0A5J4Z8U2_PORPP|nr:hypothetical protein FVE85_7057 [Porphyridium purpureum]|eukprot:POR5971..scf295_1